MLLSCIGCKNSNNTEANATNTPTTLATDTNQESTSSDPIAYYFENGTSITKEKLLAPINLYNKICTTGNSTDFTKVYPQKVLDFFIKSANQESVSDYATMLFNLYTQIYGDNFSMTNNFIDCEPLNNDKLDDFITFYADNLDFSIVPEYAFIITSEFNISYVNDAGTPTTDSDTDYFIVYYYDNNMYLDYLYIDTLDL